MSDAVLEALLSNEHTIPVLLVGDGTIQRANAAALAELGAGARVGARAVELFEETCRAKFERALMLPGFPCCELQVIRPAREPWALEFLIVPLSGKHLLVAQNMAAGYADGTVRRMLETNSDLVNRTREFARYAAELAAARTELARTGELRDQFIAMLSHDLRSPLNAVLLTASLLERAKESPKDVARHAALIHRNMDRVLHIVDTVVDVARVENPTLEIAPDPVALDAVARAVADSLGPVALDAGVELEVRAREGAAMVGGDESLLHRAIANLVSNAIRYAPPSSVVTIAIERDGGTVRCSVSDEGPGVAPEAQASLFQRYRQGSAHPGKAGLGLYIVRRILELHGGGVTLETRSPSPSQSPSQSHGATFVITLPALDVLSVAGLRAQGE